jgi:hypothetical protein
MLRDALFFATQSLAPVGQGLARQSPHFATLPAWVHTRFAAVEPDSCHWR